MNYQELEDMVQTHEDSIGSLSDGLASLSDDFTNYTDQNDQNISDLQNTQGQLTFPLSQDTIDLIKQAVGSLSQTYSGNVNADATTSVFPSGWTCTVGGTGGSANTYTVTHNLGRTDYTVVATPLAASLPSQFLIQNADSFTVQFSNGTSFFATAWNFVLNINP